MCLSIIQMWHSSHSDLVGFRNRKSVRQSAVHPQDPPDHPKISPHCHALPLCLPQPVSLETLNYYVCISAFSFLPWTNNCSSCYCWFIFGLIRSLVFAILQPVPVQWWEHDGPVQLGHMLWPHAHAHPREPGPGLLPSSRQWHHQDNHHSPWDHFSWCQRTGWAHLWEVYGWRRLLVRMAEFNLLLLFKKVPKNKLGDFLEIYTWVNNRC